MQQQYKTCQTLQDVNVGQYKCVISTEAKHKHGITARINTSISYFLPEIKPQLLILNAEKTSILVSQFIPKKPWRHLHYSWFVPTVLQLFLTNGSIVVPQDYINYKDLVDLHIDNIHRIIDRQMPLLLPSIVTLKKSNILGR